MSEVQKTALELLRIASDRALEILNRLELFELRCEVKHNKDKSDNELDADLIRLRQWEC